MEQKKIFMTGDRPTGKLHIGHYVGAIKRRVELQNSGLYDECYVMIADTQALTDYYDNPDKIRESVVEVALDYLSCGVDPDKSVIFVQSRIPELFELTCYFLDLVTLSRLERNPTVKSEMRQKGMEESIPVGFLCYPVSQAADITAFDADTVPAGEDQAPMVEQCQEIVHKFNSLYGETLAMPHLLLPEKDSCKRLPGLDGKAKMSKSLNNCIYLSDDERTVEKKVMTMFTDPTHLTIEDKGHTENNPVFIYLEAFAKDEHFARFYPQYPNLEALERKYREGGLGDVEVKKFLAKVINDVLDPIRKRRHELENDIPAVYKILEEGSLKAREKAMQTLRRVRRALKINYFEDKKLIEKQVKRFRKQHQDEENLRAYLAKQKKN
ncbi:MAG TPA: tryptophan--tRNA ligase [Candidatus Enterosoma merdigallinarum]|nr:tryptophan--tRNA ligase [Candidatus Enterosoma merdigallinarum]